MIDCEQSATVVTKVKRWITDALSPPHRDPIEMDLTIATADINSIAHTIMHVRRYLARYKDNHPINYAIIEDRREAARQSLRAAIVDMERLAAGEEYYEIPLRALTKAAARLGRPRRPGRPGAKNGDRPHWHDWALALQDAIHSALVKSSNGKKVSKAHGRIVTVMMHALREIDDQEYQPGAIEEVLRRRERKRH